MLQGLLTTAPKCLPAPLASPLLTAMFSAEPNWAVWNRICRWIPPGDDTMGLIHVRSWGRFLACAFLGVLPGAA